MSLYSPVSTIAVSNRINRVLCFGFAAGKQVEPMLKGMTNHVMEYLLDNGFYTVMRVRLIDRHVK